jgi:hypothetical protein
MPFGRRSLREKDTGLGRGRGGLRNDERHVIHTKRTISRSNAVRYLSIDHPIFTEGWDDREKRLWGL